MTDTEVRDVGSESQLAALQRWLDATWSPDLTVGDWWSAMAAEGWSAPDLPGHAHGRGLSRSDAGLAHRAILDHGALGPPVGIGLYLAAPTIAAHGTQDQIDRLVPPILRGQEAWCQLFSEPGAGSDLAGLQTRATPDGDHYTVTGQKVWTSSGHIADRAMLVARTDPDVAKHAGLTWFAMDMHQPGVEVVPLREMTGRSLFNEVFLDQVLVSAADVIGGLGNGWAVTNSTLLFERTGLGAGGGAAHAVSAIPGTIAGHLDRRAGDLLDAPAAGPGRAAPTADRWLVELARRLGVSEDPVVRQDLARLHTLITLGRLSVLRGKAAAERGEPIAGLPNISKLNMSTITRLVRDAGLGIAGARGMLHRYPGAPATSEDEALAALLDELTETALFAAAVPIYGGTDQIQRNILAERVLGLPRDPK
ncbi:MAG: putative acyl-CoA dehydrogenase [Acidimicrobiales bacterium]|nr:putative acyl-CoA dehydrogenase [Acidimicrobiales bacterium]